MRKLFVVYFLLGTLIGGCILAESETISTVYADDQVSLKLTDKELAILNVGEETMYYAIFPAEILPYMDWAPCSDPQTCPEKLLPGEDTIVSLRGIVERDTTTIAFFWYHLVENADGTYAAQDLIQPLLDIP